MEIGQLIIAHAAKTDPYGFECSLDRAVRAFYVPWFPITFPNFAAAFSVETTVADTGREFTIYVALHDPDMNIITRSRGALRVREGPTRMEHAHVDYEWRVGQFSGVPLAAPGDYVVVISVNGEEQRRAYVEFALANGSPGTP